jgi:diguanylate cyclase (GGDEF)-like protein/PAS domain S-box-containing protein
MSLTNRIRASAATLTGRDALANLALAVGYGVLGVGGVQLAFFHPQATTIWPPSGIALAALLLFGPRLAPGIWAGAFAVTTISSGSLVAALGVATGNTLAACVGWALLRRTGFDGRLSSLDDAGNLLVYGAMLDALIAAVLGPSSLFLAGVIGGADFPVTVLTWWVGDALGILLVVPLALTLSGLWRDDQSARDRIEGGVTIAAQAALAAMIFSGLLERLIGLNRLDYLLLPIGIVLALRHRPAFTALSNAIVFAIVAWGTMAGLGPFARGVVPHGLLIFHVAVLVFFGTTLLVSAASRERNLALARASSNAERFQRLTELSTDWYWEQDENYRNTYMSPRYSSRTGLRMKPTLGQSRFEIDNIWESEEQKRSHREDLDARRPFRDLRLSRCDEEGELRHFSISGDPVFDSAGRFVGYRGIGRDITAEKGAEAALRASEERFRSLTELSSDWYWEQDETLRFTLVSGASEGRAGFGGRVSLGKTRFELPNIFESDEARRAHEEDLLARRPFRDLVLKRVTPDGDVRFALISGEPLFEKSGRFLGYRGVGRDITALKRTEQRLARLRDFYAALSQINEAIIRTPGREALFRQVCDVVVARGAVEFARIGMLDERTRLVSTVASGGNDHGLADRLYFSLDPQAEGGQAPSAEALRTGRHFICNDVRADARIFRGDLLLKAGLLSAGTFPLVVGGRPFGALHLYSRETQFFDAELIALLDRLALNVSFALENLERETAREQAERAVAESQRFFESLLNAIASPIVVKNENHRFVAFNDAAVSFLGKPREWLVGKTDYDLFSEERAQFLQRTDDLALTSSKPVEYESTYAVGSERHAMLVNKSALTRSDGSRVLVLVMTDVTERKAAEEALKASEQRFRDVAEVAGEYVWENDLQGRFTYLSPKVVEVLGYTAEELLGRKGMEFMPPGEAERVRAWFAEHMGADRRFRNLEHQIVARSGEVLWLQVSGVSTFDEHGKPTGHRGTTRDVTALKRSEAKISYLATRDSLTELPNRLLFSDRLEQGLISARRAGDSLGVLFIDLDRFKNINDSLGHQVGDQLLKEVAQRMAACIRRGDTLARLGGDEFVIALEHLKRAEDAAQVAAKIVRALSRPAEIGGNTLNTSCSIGISIYPNDADDAATLMKNADTAMYYAKEKGRNNFQFFSPDMNVRAVERHKLEVSLRKALDQRDFILLYQPQVAVKTGQVIGAEALIRWKDPERGLVAPSSFITVAEESGLIEPIGRWVLMEACAQARKWQQDGLPEVRVAINISTRQLLDPKEFLAYVNRVLDETGLEPRLLELEMTESLLLANIEENAAVLHKLGKLGVHIAVDDFGTGYSSLAYLKQLPIDSLKIDRTFVRDIETDPEDAAIIKAIIAMAHELKLKVTAEGVETRGQLEALRRLACDDYQGFLLSKPVASEEFAARFLREGNIKLAG